MKRIVPFAFVLTLIAAPAFAASQWSTVGGDSGNTRYSSLAANQLAERHETGRSVDLGKDLAASKFPRCASN